MALGTFSAPSTWRLEEVVAAFLERHPNMTVRFLSRNSSAIAERVRRGELEAGLVLLPIDDERLDVRPVVRDELLYVSADPERTRRPATIERLASAPLIFYDAEAADGDPIRRLLAERAQAHGLRLRPRVEVEMAELALSLVARGLGDTYLPVSYTHAPYYPDRSHHGVLHPRALQHVRDRHPARRAAGTRHARAARRARAAHAHPRGRIRPLTMRTKAP